MKTLMIDMDNVITDGNVLQIISDEIGREIKVGDTFYLQNLIENKQSFWNKLRKNALYEGAPLIKDAYEVLKKLNEEYDIYIVTSYLWDQEHDISASNLKYKYEYLQENLPFIPASKYIFTTNKTLLNFDIAIDDRKKNLQGAKEKYLFSAWHNYNDELTDEIRVSSWKEIEYILLKKE